MNVIRVLLCTLFACAVAPGCASLSLDAVRGDFEVAEVTQLMRDAQGGDVDSVRKLLADGADVNAKSDTLRTALHAAVLGGSSKIATALMSAGADLDALDDFVMTPLHHACLRGDLEMTRQLTRRGASLDILDGFGRTPLHFAASGGHDEVTFELVSLGALIVALDNDAEELAATGASYLARASWSESSGRRGASFVDYGKANEYFDRAAAANEELADEARSNLFWQRTQFVSAIALVVIAQGLAEVGTQIQAEQQAQRFAEYQALRHAGKTRGGLPAYHRALQTYKSTYRANVVPSYGVYLPGVYAPATLATSGKGAGLQSQMTGTEALEKRYRTTAAKLREAAERARVLAEQSKQGDAR